MSEVEKIETEFLNDSTEFLRKLIAYRRKLCDVCPINSSCPLREGLMKMEEEFMSDKSLELPVLAERLPRIFEHVCGELVIQLMREEVALTRKAFTRGW